MTTRRWFLILGYTLATVLAPGLHDHGHEAHDAPRALAGCEDHGVHLAAHTDAPDLSHEHEVCQACQIQVESRSVPRSVCFVLDDGRGSGPLHTDPSIDPTTPRHRPSRAPPLA